MEAAARDYQKLRHSDNDHPKRPGDEDPSPPCNIVRNVIDMNAHLGGFNVALLKAGSAQNYPHLGPLRVFSHRSSKLEGGQQRVTVASGDSSDSRRSCAALRAAVCFSSSRTNHPDSRWESRGFRRASFVCPDDAISPPTPHYMSTFSHWLRPRFFFLCCFPAGDALFDMRSKLNATSSQLSDWNQNQNIG
ncbi:hypothetical protein HPP92_025649 [Vanilla planifolia]|uniref:Uncharacterized protein n=1 Tax=Vanilla planifolia TaxID=51239 RepID=A0A835PIE4_VANPL|nr:hypothetical protein HPP92_025649 [Vanilla planifolia]